MSKRVGSSLVLAAMGLAVVASLGGCGKRVPPIDITPKPKPAIAR